MNSIKDVIIDNSIELLIHYFKIVTPGHVIVNTNWDNQHIQIHYFPPHTTRLKEISCRELEMFHANSFSLTLSEITSYTVVARRFDFDPTSPVHP